MEETLTIVEKTVFLMEIDYFKNMETEQVAHIAARSKELHFEEGDWIFREEEPANAAFLVVEGGVEIWAGGAVIRRLTQGAAFGLLEVAAGNQTFSVSARAAEHTHVLTFSREDVLDAVRDYPDFAIGLISSYAAAIIRFVSQIEEMKRTRPTDGRGREPERRGPERG